MKIENLDLQSQIDSLNSDLDSQVTSLSTRINGNTSGISACNTKINNLTNDMKYFAALSLYSSESNASSYQLNNSLVNDLSMYHFFVAEWVIYNNTTKTSRHGAVVIPAINDTFLIHAEWLVGVNSIWQAIAQFHIDFSGKRIYRDIEYDADGGATDLHVVLTRVWGFCDADLITS